MYITTQKELAPEEDQGILFNIVKTPQTANLDYLEQATAELNKVFETVPEKEHVFIINGFGNDVHQAFAGILFKPWEERKRTQKQILQSLQPKVARHRRRRRRSRSRCPRCRARPAARRCSSSSRTTADYPSSSRRCWPTMQAEAHKSGLFIFTDTDLKFETPQVELKIDHDKANRLGITMQDIGGSLATLLGGNYVNRFNLYGRSYQVIPQVPRDFRLTADWLKRYQVRTTDGALVPLSSVATVDAVGAAQRADQLPAAQLGDAVGRAVPRPHGRRGHRLPQGEGDGEACPKASPTTSRARAGSTCRRAARWSITFVFALIIIYLVLAAQYESFRDPLIILIALPTAMFGALMPLNLGLGDRSTSTRRSGSSR